MTNFTNVPNLILDSIGDMPPNEVKVILMILRASKADSQRAEIGVPLPRLACMVNLTPTDLKKALMGLFRRGWIEESRIQSLGHLDVTRARELTKARYEDLKPLVWQKKRAVQELVDFSGGTCEWCCGETVAMQEIHFPLPQDLGGKETDHVCPNCKAEFEQLESDECYRLAGELKAIALEGG